MKPTINISFWHALALLALGMPLTVRGQDRVLIESAAKPLKVYILAGQSNMVGTGAIKTFDYIGDDPKTAPLLEQMRGPDGKPYVCKRVWISYLNGRQNQYGGEGIGRLTAGYGLREKDKHSEPWDYIGPEYMFGITMERNYDGPILIIKTAWGGQSLSVDYRSPSAGPYVLNDFQRELYGEQGRLEQNLAAKRKQTGQNYRWMIEHVKKVLGDIKRVYPDYDPSRGYEVAGLRVVPGFQRFDRFTHVSQEPGHKAIRPLQRVAGALHSRRARRSGCAGYEVRHRCRGTERQLHTGLI